MTRMSPGRFSFLLRKFWVGIRMASPADPHQRVRACVFSGNYQSRNRSPGFTTRIM